MPGEGEVSHGNHMAIGMALGFLIMGGGARTFATSNEAVAALVIALYPRFPQAPNDHRCHLQVGPRGSFSGVHALAFPKA